LDAVAENLIFNLDLFPEGAFGRDFSIAPSAFQPYLMEEVRNLGSDAEEPPELVTSLRGHLDLRLSGRRLFVSGAFAVKVNMSCARCLTNFVGKVGDEIDEIVEIGEPSLLPEADDPDSFIGIKNRELDLTPLLAELFWLSWPIRALCSPDCKGLCPKCGANLNEGPCDCGKDAETRH
jgi:uncharacterized metal-binding protein YceD (DUF177 family)